METKALEYQGRLPDMIVTAFHQACSHGNGIAAAHLIRALESVFTREEQTALADRRKSLDMLAELRLDLLLAASPAFDHGRSPPGRFGSQPVGTAVAESRGRKGSFDG